MEYSAQRVHTDASAVVQVSYAMGNDVEGSSDLPTKTPTSSVLKPLTDPELLRNIQQKSSASSGSSKVFRSDFQTRSASRITCGSAGQDGTSGQSECSSSPMTRKEEAKSQMSRNDPSDTHSAESVLRIVIFKAQGCQACTDVILAFQSAKIPYSTVDLTCEPWRRNELQKLSQSFLVPQIFVDDRHIGGRDVLLSVTNNFEVRSMEMWYEDNTKERSSPSLERIVPTLVSPENEDEKTSISNSASYGKHLEEMAWKTDTIRRLVGYEEVVMPSAELIETVLAAKWTFSVTEAKTEVLKLVKAGAIVFPGVSAESVSESTPLPQECVFEKLDNLNCGVKFSQIASDARSADDVISRLRSVAAKLFDKLLFAKGHGVDYGETASYPGLWKTFLGLFTELQGIRRLELKSDRYRMAFFINLYNVFHFACCVMLGCPSSSSERHRFYATTVKIGEFSLSLDDIEHGCLRGVKFGYKDPRTKLIIPLDPRIHFALNCGAKSCPSISVYSVSSLPEELQWATAAFCSKNVVVLDDETVLVSRLFTWYRDDFVTSFGGNLVPKALVEWIVENGGLNTTGDLYMQLSTMLMKDSRNKTSKIRIKWATYDWSTATRGYGDEGGNEETALSATTTSHMGTAMVKSDIFFAVKRKKEKKFYGNRMIRLIQ